MTEYIHPEDTPPAQIHNLADYRQAAVPPQAAEEQVNSDPKAFSGTPSLRVVEAGETQPGRPFGPLQIVGSLKDRVVNKLLAVEPWDTPSRFSKHR